MTKSSISNDMATKQPRSAAILLLITIVDTTWRAFLPTIGGTFLGIWIDHSLNTEPTWTAIMIAFGVCASTLLIYAQIKNVRKTK